MRRVMPPGNGMLTFALDVIELTRIDGSCQHPAWYTATSPDLLVTIKQCALCGHEEREWTPKEERA
jgi:hypothetical protein